MDPLQQVYICFLAILHVSWAFTGSDLNSRYFISKCLSKYDNSMTIRCPKRHVMLLPKTVAGYSIKNTCMFNKNDCLGYTPSLLKQTRACLYQEVCTIKLRRSLEPLTLVTGPTSICSGKPMEYAAVIVPKCIPKDNVHDLCSNMETLKGRGILRSNRDDIHTVNKSRCTQRFGSTSDFIKLTLRLISLDVNSTNRPKVVWTSEKGKLKKKTIRNTSTFSMTGSKFRLIWRPRGEASSFIISYKVSTPFHLFRRRLNKYSLSSSDRPSRMSLKPSMTPKASLETRMTQKMAENESFTCPPGKVIYSPDLRVRSSGKSKCTGLSPHLITQKNECYWRQNCTISWNGPVFLVHTAPNECFGQMANTLVTEGFQCHKRANIQTLRCKSQTRLKSAGIIRSHENFPWHYRGNDIECRMRLKVGNGRRIRFFVDLVDIDDDTDSFKMVHIQRRKRTTILEGNYQGLSKSISGGYVEITMNTNKRSKSGSGFVIRYKQIRRGRKGSRGRNVRSRKTLRKGRSST